MTKHLPLLLFILLAACDTTAGGAAGGGSVDTTGLRTLAVPAEYQAGEQLYDATCAACHGGAALGTAQGPPLVHIVYEPNHHADAAFLLAVQRGVRAHHWRFGNMPPQPGVTPEEAQTITDYVRWLQREAGVY